MQVNDVFYSPGPSMTIHSLTQPSGAVAATLPSLNARKPDALTPDPDRVELSDDARSAQRHDTIGSAESLPGQGDSETSETHGKAGFAGSDSASRESNDESVVGSVEDDGHLHMLGEKGLEGEDEGDGEDVEQEIDPAKKSSTGDTLSEEEQAEVQKLRERDREVRTHEQAHVAAGGSHVRGGIKYEYQAGPDGRRYAVGGEVSIDTSPVSGDPQKTIQKAQQVRRAALAPAEPSGADRSAAAAAAQMEAEARKELIEERANPAEEGEAASSDAEVSGGSSEEIDAAGPEATAGLGAVEPNEVEVGGPDEHESGSAAYSVSPKNGPTEFSPTERPEKDEPEMSDFVQGIQDRTEGSAEASAQRVATLFYGVGSNSPGGFLDVTT